MKGIRCLPWAWVVVPATEEETCWPSATKTGLEIETSRRKMRFYLNPTIGNVGKDEETQRRIEGKSPYHKRKREVCQTF